MRFALIPYGQAVLAGNPFNGGVTLDNYGSPATGEHRLTVNLGVDGPLGLHDAWFMSLSSNTDPDHSARLSESALLSVNLPYGYWNLVGSVSRSRYVSEVNSASQTFVSSGDTNTYSLGMQRVLRATRPASSPSPARSTTRSPGTTSRAAC